jgi:hypothetical protein
VRRVSARNPPACPALQPPPSARGTPLPRFRPCLRPSHLAELDCPRSLPANPRQSLPLPALGGRPEKTRAWKLGLQERGQDGERHKSPRDAQGASQSGVLSGEGEKRGVPNPRYVREGTGETRGPQSEYDGNQGSSVLIRSAPYLVPSLPGMTREGEEKPGKAPELDRGPHPSPHRAPPSYLVPKRNLRPWGCASYGPRGEAAASSGSRCAQMLAAVKSTKGLPVRAPPLASLLPGPMRRTPGRIRQRTWARDLDGELGREGGVREPGETAVVRAGECRVRVRAASEAARAGIYPASTPRPPIPGTARPVFL